MKQIVETKGQEMKELRQAYKQMEQEVQMAKVEVEFYRHHFKELTKVSRERKIKFFVSMWP